MSKECKLSNDAYSPTVLQLSATCIWTTIFNLKNILFNKWIALDSGTCLYISSPTKYQTTWSIACHLCKRHYEILTSTLAFWTAHLCVHTCPQATLVFKKKSFREITIVEGLIANARFCHGSSRSRFLIYNIYLYRLYCCYSGMNKTNVTQNLFYWENKNNVNC